MESVARYAGAIIIGYLLGAIPFGLLAGKLAGGVDVRKHGSHSSGTTNVLRVLGWRMAILVLMADTAKGVGAVLIAALLSHNQILQAGAGIAAVAGHNWPVYVGFRGGRGVCAGVGGLLVLSLWVALPALGLWLIVVAFTRYVSLGSILSPVLAIVLSVILAALGREPVAVPIYVATASVLILVQHRANIVRLVKGTERKLGQRVG